MIRFRRLTQALLDAWLVDQSIPSSHPHYRLRLWQEDRAALATIEAELRLYLDEIFDDVRQRLRRGFGDDLSPFNDPATDPAANYPALLNRVTLQGYLGETLAVLAVEHWGAMGHTDWAVPALLFRLHYQEFQHLELINERLRGGQTVDPDAREELRPGRTGDDALAFRMNGEGEITDVLALEAKCLATSHNAEIESAHQKLANGGQRPSGIHELITLLEDYSTPQADEWQKALLQLWRGGYLTAARHDGVAYACGRIPIQGGRITWLAANAPHAAYTVARQLEAMEFQFGDLDAIVTTLYRG